MQEEKNNQEQLVADEQTPETVQSEAAAPDVEAQPAETTDNTNDAKVEELQASLLRMKADFDNFKRRTQEERTQLSLFVTADVIGKILPVLDSLQRAQTSMAATSDEATLTGLDMIVKQFEQALAGIGVEQIKALGEKFNPEVHEAVMRGENPDLPEETIEMVFEEGYICKGKVIRYSKVKVAN